MSELNVIDVAATHRIKFSVSWEKDPDQPRSSAREVRTACPTARSRRSGRCRRRTYAASGKVEFADTRVPVETAGVRIVFVHVPEAHAIRGVDSGHAIVAP